MLTPTQHLTQLFRQAITQAFGSEYQEVDPVIKRSQGKSNADYQANFAMRLAGQLKRKPQEIAQIVIDSLSQANLPHQFELSGPGFINIYLANSFLSENLALMQEPRLGVAKVQQPQRMVIDYGSPNIAKEMHVGHIRSTVIGDALSRIFTFIGHDVVRQNHLGDWGTQFGMLIEQLMDTHWFEQQDNKNISALNKLYQQSKQRFDAEPEFAEKARARVVALQQGDASTLAYWHTLVDISCQSFQELYQRLGLLLEQSDNCGESFYNDKLNPLVDELLERGVAKTDGQAVIIPLEGFVDKDKNPLPFLIRKSDGGFLYATTDMAAIKYRTDTLKAKRIIYVVDARQKQHFSMLFAAAKKAGWFAEHVQLDHVAFGSILGQDKKPFKTRSGETIKLQSLMDESQSRALAIVQEKNSALPADEQQQVADVVGIAAIKYADLVNDLHKDYIFDWQHMLAFEGNTAPYLLNAYVRIKSLFRKAEWQGPDGVKEIPLTEEAEKQLAIELVCFPEVILRLEKDLAIHKLCAYLYDLASCFHRFYEHCSVLKAPSEVMQARLRLCHLTASVLKQGLSLLGIEVVERM